jgi:hypothetical protein
MCYVGICRYCMYVWVYVGIIQGGVGIFREKVYACICRYQQESVCIHCSRYFAVSCMHVYVGICMYLHVCVCM